MAASYYFSGAALCSYNDLMQKDIALYHAES